MPVIYIRNFCIFCLLSISISKGMVEYIDIRLIISKDDDYSFTNTVLSEICEKEIVLLGENGFHGEGRTLSTKVMIVRKLLERCDFDAVFFESSFYDFLALSRLVRNNSPTPESLVASAIGGIWNGYREIGPFISYLHGKLQNDGVMLGGLDDQLGTRGAFYSLDEMPRELAGLLNEEMSDECGAVLKRRIYYRYSEDRPYSVDEHRRLLHCLDEISNAVANFVEYHGFRKIEINHIVSSIRRTIERDFLERNEVIHLRDKSMYLNFRFLKSQLPAGSKVIVWSANSHVAKDASLIEPYRYDRSLGGHIHAAYGDAAFALGFSAAGGSYASRGGGSKKIPQPPSNALESHSFMKSNRNFVYLNGTRLSALGDIPAGLFNHDYLSANWSRIFDGIIVFRKEHPPRPIRR